VRRLELRRSTNIAMVSTKRRRTNAPERVDSQRELRVA
jgi:hypothetical protein